MDEDSTRNPNWSLRRRLALGLVSATLLPVLLFSAALLWSQWRSDHDALLLRLDSNARLNASIIDDFLESQLAGVRLLADQMATEAPADEAALDRLLYVYPAMLRVLHVDTSGRIIAVRDTRGRTLSSQVRGVAEEEWFKVARNQYRVFVSDVQRQTEYGDEVVATISAPLLRGQRFEGALQAAVPVDSFARLTADSLARRKLQLLLLDRTNHVIYAGSELRWTVLQEAGAAGEQLRREAVAADRPGRVVRMPGLLRDGDAAYVDAVAMRNGWTLVLVAPVNLLLAPILPRLLLVAVLLAMTLTGVAAALWWQRQMLKHNIGYLLASLHGYALGGKLDPALRSRLPEELQPLAEGIGELGGRMNTAFEELNQALGEREAVIEERTESLREAVSKLDHLSRTDAMTGCLNYRGFIETGGQLWQDAVLTDAPLSVLALDIDHFKAYNDLYGHAAGDGALRRFAGAVRSALLHTDDVLARPGGEEFTVFLPGSTLEQALQVAERVCRRVRDADINHAGSVLGKLTVSIGVAARMADDSHIEDMLKRADAALYRAKAAGRNGVSA